MLFKLQKVMKNALQTTKAEMANSLSQLLVETLRQIFSPQIIRQYNKDMQTCYRVKDCISRRNSIRKELKNSVMNLRTARLNLNSNGTYRGQLEIIKRRHRSMRSVKARVLVEQIRLCYFLGLTNPWSHLSHLQPR